RVDEALLAQADEDHDQRGEEREPRDRGDLFLRLVAAERRGLRDHRGWPTTVVSVGAVGANTFASAGMSTIIRMPIRTEQPMTAAISLGSLYSPSGRCTALCGSNARSRYIA